MENIFDWSVILSLVGVLVVITNIIVQVLKKLTWDKLPTNILATLVAIVLTLGAFFAYCQIKSITVVWYMVAAAVVLALWLPTPPCSALTSSKRSLHSWIKTKRNKTAKSRRGVTLSGFFLRSMT